MGCRSSLRLHRAASGRSARASPWAGIGHSSSWLRNRPGPARGQKPLLAVSANDRATGWRSPSWVKRLTLSERVGAAENELIAIRRRPRHPVGRSYAARAADVFDNYLLT